MQTLSAISLDALKEVGNIGAGNATTALATMLERVIEMSIPDVSIVSLDDFTHMTGGPEALSACIYMSVEGEAPGHVAFLMPIASARCLVDQTLQQPSETTVELDELATSVLMETGNILASSYLVAICEMTGMNLLSSPPAIAVDMTAAILSTVATQLSPDEDDILTIVTQICEEAGTVAGYFIFIPEPGSLPAILRALQLEP